MVNYCDNGLYFESNSSLAEGAEIILGIENSPYSNGSDVIDVYRAKILWRQPIQSNFYKFQTTVCNLQIQIQKQPLLSLERRIHVKI
mgnify:CR=1 FL=1